jgi:hypothetical protein
MLPKIPRILHQVWLGTDPVPELLGYYTETWRRHHPLWDVRLWTDDTVPPLSCPTAADAGFKIRYDMVRLEVLRRFGGVVIDMDVEAIRPIDPLIENVEAFVGRIKGRHLGNQVLGAVPGHPFFERAVERLKSWQEASSASAAAGKDFLRQLFEERADGVTVFPPETFYFQPSFAPPRQPDRYPSVYAVHHELETYSAPPPLASIEQSFATFFAELKSLDARLASGVDLAPRRAKAERRLRRAVARYTRGYRAALRRAQAEREQLAVRRFQSEAKAQIRIQELQRELEAARAPLARAEAEHLSGWIRRALAAAIHRLPGARPGQS